MVWKWFQATVALTMEEFFTVAYEVFCCSCCFSRVSCLPGFWCSRKVSGGIANTIPSMLTEMLQAHVVGDCCFRLQQACLSPCICPCCWKIWPLANTLSPLFVVQDDCSGCCCWQGSELTVPVAILLAGGLNLLYQSFCLENNGSSTLTYRFGEHILWNFLIREGENYTYMNRFASVRHNHL